MKYPVVRGTAYALVHAPHLLLSQGSTQCLERAKNPHSQYLRELPSRLRSFPQAVNYPPNQVFIGNMLPDELAVTPKPWFEHPVQGQATGKFGEIMAEDHFFGLMKICDSFDLIQLEEGFAAKVKSSLGANPLFSEEAEGIPAGVPLQEIEERIAGSGAEPLSWAGKLVGCIKKAHDWDANLSAHHMVENLAVKASGVLALKHLLAKNQVDPEEIDYILECSEEACGDVNQRGGGNFAKAIGEVCRCLNATGSDTRGFCAAPVHALVLAAGLVQAGIYKNVVVVAGGATAKLGMNGRDHLAKGLPLLEDTLGAFAVLVSENDGLNPLIRTDGIGRHNIGRGSAPQAVMEALVTDPLEKLGLKITDVDKFSVEMQNPEITVPAGAGDVPAANYKMIGALGVKRGNLEKQDLAAFVEKHGMPGFAPTQGHIPSGVPFIGHAREQMLAGTLNRTMIIGKGSLFLARMTNLFDGVSFCLEANPGTGGGPDSDPDAVKKVVAQAMREVAERLLAGK